MTAIVFPTSSSPGERPGEGSGRLVNVRAVKDGSDVAYAPVGGATAFCDLGFANVRGVLPVDSLAYVAVTDHLLRVDGTGAVSLMGDLPGSGPVTMARNNRQPVPDVAIVADGSAFYCDGSTVEDYPDSDVGSPNSVDKLDGYFVFGYGSGLIVASDLNSTNINDQSNTRAEGRSGGLVRLLVKNSILLAFKAASVEFYSDVGASPFPFSRYAPAQDVGLLTAWAIAGAEEGWGGPLMWVAQDGTVKRSDNGLQVTSMPNREVERFITRSTAATLRAAVFVDGGNPVWSLSSDLGTWEYNVTTDEWNERRSYGLGRWRGQAGARCFGRWLFGDLSSTKLLAIDPTARRELADPLICRAEGRLKSFPGRFRATDLRFDVSTGQGRAEGIDPIETDPMASISWSHDGGGTWGVPVLRSMGRQGEYGRAVSVSNLGTTTAQGLRVALEVSDPVGFTLRAASVDTGTRKS